MGEIQSTGSYDPMSDEFSMSFAPNDSHLITFDGLSIEDIKNIQSLVDILLYQYGEVHK